MQKKIANSLSAALALASCGAIADKPVENDSRPNILVIMTDDQGYGQLNFASKAFKPEELSKKFGTERYKCDPAQAIAAAQKAMPNLTALANNGVKFTNGYVASPVCGPSRAAFTTARCPSRSGIYDNPDLWNGLDVNEKILAEDFQKAGYSTAMIGKWHLGKNIRKKVETDSRDYHDKSIHFCIKEHHPLSRGFDYYYGFNSSGAAYYNSPDMFRNFDNVKAPGYITENFTNETVKFIKKSKNKPFFIYLAYNAPHIPLEKRAPEKYQRFNTGNPEVDNYYATLAAVDDGIGEIVAELKKQNKFKNTLIFFLSDNGAVIDSPEPANGEFKGYKGLTFQGGVHVPMFACWPAKLPKGKEFTENISSMDFIPTALTAAGIKVPSNLDGKNLLPYIEGRKKGKVHEYLFWAGPHNYHWSEKNIEFWKNYYRWITHKTDKKANTHKKKGPSCWTVLSGKWMLQANADKKSMALYNIEKDPGETTDISSSNPKIVERLAKAFGEWIKDKKEPAKWSKESWLKLKQ